jgi:hypothetical protein
MKITLSTYEVSSQLMSDDYAGWTYEEARVLAEYYEQLEEDTGEEIIFNACSIRCDWNSYSSIQEVRNAYPSCPEEEDEALEWLEERAQVLEVPASSGVAASLLVTAF